MDRSDLREYASLAAVGQGVVAAVAPRVSVWVVKRLVGRNFENADELEPRPAYVRRTRAAGVGLAAAGIAGWAMERVADADARTADADARTADTDAQVTERDASAGTDDATESGE